MSIKVKQNHFLGMRATTEIMRSNGRKYTQRKTRGRFFFPDEWMAFFDCLKEKQQPTFMFLINTGARIMEIQNIKVSDVDFERGNIVLRITKAVVNKPKEGIKGKRNIRILTVSSKFIKYLEKIIRKYDLKSDDYFPILSTPASNIAMKKALIKAGIKDYDMFSLHNIRKTLETWLLALDIDSFKIVKHFGHGLQVALKHYVSGDIFNYSDKEMMRTILGDLFQKS